MTSELYTGTYLLMDETEGDCHGEYDSMEEALETAMCLRDRDYYLTTSLEDGHRTVMDTEEFAEALAKLWDEKEED